MREIPAREPSNQTTSDLSQFEAMAHLFESSGDKLVDRIDAFPKYASRQSLAKFLTKYEIFREIISVHGSIIEGGVLHGGGLLAWAKLSSILEPSNHTRRVIGFDTFQGFPQISAKDTRGTSISELTREGGLSGSPYEEVQDAIDVYNMNRPLSHIPKVELVVGDVTTTAQQYLDENPHTVVSLLYLDLDLFEPTKAMLDTFLERIPRGGVIAFDELNAGIFPGETLAVLDSVGLSSLRLRRFPFDPYVSYAVL